VALHPAAFVLLAVAVVLVLLGRRQAPEREQTILEERFEGRLVADLAALVAQEERRWLEHETELRAHGQVAAAAAAARRSGVATVAAALADPSLGADECDARAMDYLRGCERQRAYLQARGELAQAREAVRLLGAADETAASARTALEGAEAELRRRLGEAGITDADVEAALRIFDDLVAADAERRAAAERRAGTAGRLEQLLAGRTLDELRAQAGRAELALAAHAERHEDAPVTAERDGDLTICAAVARSRWSAPLTSPHAARSASAPSATPPTSSCSSTSSDAGLKTWSGAHAP
jgi:hypothetical protein